MTCFFVAAHCYRKVTTETNQLRDQIVQTLGLNPIEQDVVVLYKDEVANKDSAEFFEVKYCLQVSVKFCLAEISCSFIS